MRRSRLYLAGLLSLVACDTAGPDRVEPLNPISFEITSGTGQVGLPGALLREPLTIKLFDGAMNRPIQDREVTFSVLSDSDIRIEPALALTDSAGVASVQVQLGQTYGRHIIEVDFDENPGPPRKVTVEVAETPVVTQVSPRDARVNDVITITGSNFGEQPEWNDVRIDNVRAEVIRATATELRARVPRCVNSGSIAVMVRRGSLQSQSTRIAVTGGQVRMVDLDVGETMLPSSEPGCLRTTPGMAAAQYLVMPVNVAAEGHAATGFRLAGGTGISGTPAAQARLQPPDARLDFESKLRTMESALLSRVQRRPAVPMPGAARIIVPQVDDERTFKVITPWYDFITVRGVARGIGRHVVVYVDRQAQHLNTEDIDALIRTFDEVVYPTDVAVYGTPSDVDHNGRLAVLLTPVVNRMTPPGSNGFIAGFFFGCDILEPTECPESNGGEVLYGVVPDPSGVYGIRHTREFILKLLPGLVAHELQHAIHFNQRVLINGALQAETLWLSEALAHAAEDTVAAVLESRGELARAVEMRRDNYTRAAYYLQAPDRTSMVQLYGGGSLEERGAGWLLLKYLQFQKGGGILGDLTRSPFLGTVNISTVAQADWKTLIRNFTMALFASSQPELRGGRIGSSLSFGPFDLRGAVESVAGGKFTLKPWKPTRSDFTFDTYLPASSAAYLLVDVPPGGELSLTMSGPNGRDFLTGERPELVLLRVR